MQNVSDIKFSLNNSQELAVHSPKVAPDTGSSAGFFNMLKDRVSVSEQSAPGVPEKIEALKHEHSAPVDKEKEASGTATPNEERLPGAEKTADQAKPATQNQAAEAKDQDIKGIKEEKKPGLEAHVKKTDENRSDLKALNKQKTKKADGDTIAGLLDILHKLISFLDKIKDTPHAGQARAAVKGLHDLLSSLRKQNDGKELAKTLDKALSLLNRLSINMAPDASREQATAALATMKEMLAKLKSRQDKSSDQRQTARTDDHPLPFGEKQNKPAFITEGSKGEGLFQKRGDEGAAGGTLSNFNVMKGDSSIKAPDLPDASLFKNHQIRENLENIIQSARVAVKDSKNASFSLRLHPAKLGSVRISLGLLDGVVHGKFLVDTPAARDMLLTNIEQIKDELRQACISVGEFQVNVSDQRERLLHEGGDGTFTFL